jgi:hypothetical protein
MRLRRIAALLGLIALIAVPSALALAFDPYNPNLPDATVGVPYSFQFTGRGGCGTSSYTFTVVSGSIPPGLTLSSSGNLNGTPTQSGTWGFYAQLATGGSCSSQQPAQRPFSLSVIPKLTITTNSVPPGVVNVPYSQQLTFDGGGTVTWSLSNGTLPPGLSLSSTTGLISGTPTTVGSSTFTVFVKDNGSSRSDTKVLTIDVLAPLAASIGSAPSAEVGIPFHEVTPTATGGKTPYAWKVASGTLPSGLSLDPATGAITGTPDTPGSYSLQIAVTDAYNTTANVSLAIDVARQPAFRTKLLRSGKQGTPYQATLRTLGGVEPTRFKVTSGRFPIGVKLDRRAGVIAGTPRSSGTFHFTVSLTDRLGGTAQQSYTLTIKPKPKPKK